MSNKQTAVEWLEEKINLYDFQVGMASMRKYIEYAKAMEKEQIENAFYRGIQEQQKRNISNWDIIKSPEQYYEETYGK